MLSGARCAGISRPTRMTQGKYRTESSFRSWLVINQKQHAAGQHQQEGSKCQATQAEGVTYSQVLFQNHPRKKMFKKILYHEP